MQSDIVGTKKILPSIPPIMAWLGMVLQFSGFYSLLLYIPTVWARDFENSQVMLWGQTWLFFIDIKEICKHSFEIYLCALGALFQVQHWSYSNYIVPTIAVVYIPVVFNLFLFFVIRSAFLSQHYYVMRKYRYFAVVVFIILSAIFTRSLSQTSSLQVSLFGWIFVYAVGYAVPIVSSMFFVEVVLIPQKQSRQQLLRSCGALTIQDVSQC